MSNEYNPCPIEPEECWDRCNQLEAELKAIKEYLKIDIVKEPAKLVVKKNPYI